MSEKNVPNFNHSFNPYHAKLLGSVDLALIVNHFIFWIDFHKRRGSNFHEGRTWNYSSIREITEHFCYWNEDHVRRLMDKLVEKKVLMKGHHDKNPLNQTTWYAFENETEWGFSKYSYDLANLPNADGNSAKRLGKFAKCITDTKLTLSKEQQQQAPLEPSAAVSSKGKGQEPIIWPSLRDLDIPEADKIWISKKYDTYVVAHAVAFATHPKTEVTTTLAQTIKWACKIQPDLPINKEDIETKNRQYALKFDGLTKGNSIVECLNKHVEIYTKGHSDCCILQYDAINFKDLFLKFMKKYGFENEIMNIGKK